MRNKILHNRKTRAGDICNKVINIFHIENIWKFGNISTTCLLNKFLTLTQFFIYSANDFTEEMGLKFYRIRLYIFFVMADSL